MKVAPPKDVAKAIRKLILPLEYTPEDHKMDKHNSVTFDLSTAPGTATAPKCKYQARILTGQESVRAVLIW